MATSFMSYSATDISEPNEEIIDLTAPLPLYLMIEIRKGADTIGLYTEYKYTQEEGGKVLLIRVYRKKGFFLAHLLGEYVFYTHEERFVPYPTRLAVNLDTAMPQRIDVNND
jgi:hypothetical protein